MIHVRIKQLYFFRHGQTDWNAAGRIQGHLDVPLNDQGRKEAQALVRHLERFEIQAILSSDLSRARETAEIIARDLGIPVYTDEGLREIFLGKLQGLTRHEIEAAYGKEFSDRLRHEPLGDADVTHLGSESGEQVIQRAHGAIDRFLNAQGLSRIGIATHGGVVRRMIQHALGYETFPPPVPNGVLYPMKLHHPKGVWELDSHLPIKKT